MNYRRFRGLRQPGIPDWSLRPVRPLAHNSGTMYSHPEIPPGTPEKRRIPDPRPGLWRRFRAWRWVLTGSLLIAGLYTVLSWQTGRLVLKTWSAWNTVMENYGARVAGERIEKGMFFSRIDADLVRRGGEQAPLHMETRIYHYPGFDRQGGLALFHFSMAFTGPGTGGAGTVTFRGRYYYDDHFVIDLHAPARGFSPADRTAMPRRVYSRVNQAIIAMAMAI